ncbi:hypothetical protein IFM89_038059 [Coptis chinensis]|uniref:FAR1 domain-containing protein n=1 Tax=Coptis chinensis TaxID=261450 RepID=A0A835H027_9MAGN|nr:hypothetical protein IFM89_038059 [Coptis chinensis]
MDEEVEVANFSPGEEVEEMILYNDGVVPNNEFPSLSVETPNEVLEKLDVPKVGMSYQSLEEAKSYYLEYGKQNGFSTRVRSTQKRSRDRNDDEVTVCDMVCAREGKRDKVDLPMFRMSSRRTFTVREHEGFWKISKKDFQVVWFTGLTMKRKSDKRVKDLTRFIPLFLGCRPFRLGLAMLEKMASVQQSSQSTSDGDQAQKENSLIGPLSGSVLTSG